MSFRPKVLVAGFPYVREAYFNTFLKYPDKNDLFFLLPKVWKIKRGKVVFHPSQAPNVFKTAAFFKHSHYPLIGGLLKGWMPLFPWYLWRLKRKHKINLVYNCSEPMLLTTLYYGFWTKLFDLRHMIFSWENVDMREKFIGLNRIFKMLLFKLNLFLTDGLICGNRKGAAIYGRLTSKPVAVIPMAGVDTEFFVPIARDSAPSGSTKNGLIFAYAGAIDKRKGIRAMIEAFAELTKEMPNGKLVIAGSGEEEAKLEELISGLKLHGKVVVSPWLDKSNLRELLATSDIFLYPSVPFNGWEEQFGYSMAEASLMELPVISTRSGSIEDVVKDGETGILVEPNNKKALLNAMLKLAKDPDLRKKLGRAGREYITKNFSYEVVAKKFYEFFGQILVK